MKTASLEQGREKLRDCTARGSWCSSAENSVNGTQIKSVHETFLPAVDWEATEPGGKQVFEMTPLLFDLTTVFAFQTRYALFLKGANLKVGVSLLECAAAFGDFIIQS